MFCAQFISISYTTIKPSFMDTTADYNVLIVVC